MGGGNEGGNEPPGLRLNSTETVRTMTMQKTGNNGILKTRLTSINMNIYIPRSADIRCNHGYGPRKERAMLKREWLQIKQLYIYHELHHKKQIENQKHINITAIDKSQEHPLSRYSEF